ncbi:MAG: hypothetical protein IJP84_03450 [Lachnospiraceae bacterium]|nr:hypothetical protein [Lachnospiraceae bacterium]
MEGMETQTVPLQTGFDIYIKNMDRIRQLSTPSLEGVKDSSSYSRLLRENFVRIGVLAAENRTILDKELFPLINSDRLLTEEEIESLTVFVEKLIDAENAENLDLPLAFLLSERLVKDAEAKGDISSKVRCMDMHVSTCYTMMNMTSRIYAYPEISKEYREEGLRLGQIFIGLRKKESFNKTESEEERELILTNARFAAAFFENSSGKREVNELELEMLRESIRIGEDPSYRELMPPDFDWRYYRYRLLTYYSQGTDFCNIRGLDDAQIQEVCERTEELWEIWHSDPEYFSELEKESYVDLQLYRNRYYAGKITKEVYLEGLLRLYHDRDKNLYDICGIIENIQIPVEILGIIHSDKPTERDKYHLKVLFDNMIAYTLHMPNSGVLTFMLELNMQMIRYFVELPGWINFEELMLDLMAATHPPTYVHSRMVAQFSVCLCGHLIDMSPELLIGIEGCETVDDVRKNREKILDFTWHASICHDAGKIGIIDTVFVYGRKLLDREFELIKTHPKMGAAILSAFPDTAKYVDVALGHHKWYDNSRGYPEDFDTSKSPLKTLIDLVQCADCLDAATDTIGRSYSRGKSYDGFFEEIKKDSGTRYAPWLTDLLSADKVREDIEFLLSEERDRNYHDTYQRLKTVHDKEMQ